MRKLALVLGVIIGVTLCGCGKVTDSGVADESMPEIGTSELQNQNISDSEASKLQGKNTSDDGTPVSQNPNMSEGDISGTQGKNPSEPQKYTDIEQGGPYGKISISLPDGWDYELCPVDSDKLLSAMYGIHFYPKAADAGYVELAYVDNFGVCGTGLEEETATIAGNSANIGTYDNNTYWDFIAFGEEYRGIVALTYSVDDWWSDYGSQVLDILETLSFDQDDKEGGVYVYSKESEADKIGLSLSLKNISRTGATLVFDQYDAEAPTGDLDYGQEFVLEILKDSKWEEAPIAIDGEYGFNALAFMIPAGERTEVELPWEWLYGELAAGEYRIKKRVMDFRGSGDYDVYTVYAQFILN
ncbi:MAG: hypothetical protein HDR03_00215 [Lachnospiraceae bacterium]|nr:hypothetical protein [Lachnospiraceae bacterium]